MIYDKALKKDKKVAAARKKLESGTASGKDLNALAAAAGRIAGDCMEIALKDAFPSGQIPTEDVRRIISPIMKRNHAFVSDMAATFQNARYKKAGIGLKAVNPDYDSAQEDSLANEISCRSFQDGFSW